MNKRIQKKLEKKVDSAHIEALEASPWGRVTLSYERLGHAFGEFVDTLREEAVNVQKDVDHGLRKRIGKLDEELGPQLARLPVLGPSVARSVHVLAGAVA